MWLADAADQAVERDLIDQIRSRAAEDYRAVLDELASLGDDVSTRTLRRMRRELQRIGHRDFFPPPERDAAHRAVSDAFQAERVR